MVCGFFVCLRFIRLVKYMISYYYCCCTTYYVGIAFYFSHIKLLKRSPKGLPILLSVTVRELRGPGTNQFNIAASTSLFWNIRIHRSQDYEKRETNDCPVCCGATISVGRPDLDPPPSDGRASIRRYSPRQPQTRCQVGVFKDRPSAALCLFKPTTSDESR